MRFTIGISRETSDGETCVSLVPDVAGRLVETYDEVDVLAEEGAGTNADHENAA